MSCDVITEIWGPLRYSDDVWPEVKKEPDVQEEIKNTSEEQARRAGSILNPSRDGYYESKRFLKVNGNLFFFCFSRLLAALICHVSPSVISYLFGMMGKNEFI